MASVITLAFEHWKAQEAASGKPVLLNEFVFANVPNLDPAKPIDRNEKLPPANQIVHRQAVNKAGLASENAVAYSVTLGAEIGNFDYNWIGLLNKESGTVAMITHAPTQKKLKTQSGQQGNVLTRSFLLEFNGAALETQITTKAETWQIDFTARLTGIDEMQRLINVDSYGAAAFFDESFEVTRSGEQYTVKKGLGYVGGLRGELAQNQILNNLRNTKVYADFSYQGNIVSEWRTAIKITVATTLKNHIDSAGFQHYVFAIAEIDSAGNVKDLRPKGGLSDQNLEALASQTKLDLSKKIDKASITDQLGNDRTKVVSQGLLTEQLGKKQNSGDFATNTALKDGLDKKLDKSLAEKITGQNVTWAGIHQFQKWIDVSRGDYRFSMTQLDASSGGDSQLITSNNVTGAIYRSTLPKKSGSLMHLGDDGWAGIGENISINKLALISLLKERSTTSRIFRNYTEDTSISEIAWNYSSLAYFKSPVSFTAIIGSHEGNGARILAGNNVNLHVYELLTNKNTKIDKSGYLRTANSAEELMGVPIGGSVLWNGVWDDNDPIAEFYWPNEGRSFSASMYPIAAKRFPSLKLPDDRGYGIRVADNGRGIDQGRIVGTYQEDAIQNMTGSISTGIRTHSAASGNGVFKKSANINRQGTLDQNSQGGFIDLNFDASDSVRTANETRMKNVAKILITRMK